ncbi:MAG: hydrogenase iron-sulfur subunit [Rhodospirillales bacterium]|jgi:F420-non-reducing hydrogenase iron-sulfur subunit|nr:hydrogenase iron-sulfur subunit [Rhodospirillales bacterium]
MSTEQETFEPNVVAFCCRHCAYSAADLAGGGRMTYPSSIKIVEMPCTGRANVLEILHAMEKGADGVAVAGCLPGTCHYIKGNTHARQRVDQVMELLKKIGLEDQRARMINISAAMGAQFVEEVTSFVEAIKELGPSPLSGETGNTRTGTES